MSNFMTRKFSLREKIFLLILVVILLVGLYFLLVHYPIVNRNKEIDEEMEQVQTDQLLLNIQKTERDKIKAEKDIIDAQEAAGENVTFMPTYDNFAELNKKLDEIFAAAKAKFEDEKDIDRRLNWSKSIDEEAGRVTRTLSFSFACKSYEEAKFILDELAHTDWRSLLTNVSISATQDENLMSSAVSVSGSITYYERYLGGGEQSEQE